MMAIQRCKYNKRDSQGQMELRGKAANPDSSHSLTQAIAPCGDSCCPSPRYSLLHPVWIDSIHSDTVFSCQHYLSECLPYAMLLPSPDSVYPSCPWGHMCCAKDLRIKTTRKERNLAKDSMTQEWLRDRLVVEILFSKPAALSHLEAC